MTATPIDDADSGAPLVPPVQPDRGTPKTIGILNIVFGTALLLCGLCAGFYAIILSSMGPMMAAQQQQVKATMEAEQQARLKRLQDQEGAATNKEEKAALQAQQKALKAQPPPPIPDTSKMFNAPGLQLYMLTDAVTGIVLNVLMVVSGVGLVGFKEWARVAAVWAAGFKIVRLVAIYGCWVPLAMVPLWTQVFKDMFGDMHQAGAGPAGPSPEQLAQMIKTMGVMWTAYAIGFVLLGSIYPALVLILLTRPRVKAAFAAAPAEFDDQSQPG